MDHAILAEQFVANKERTQWHDKALWFIRDKRDLAARSVPEWEELRVLASKIKAHTLSRLDYYLEMFEANATKLGATVHWAHDGAEHNEIVYGILKDHGVTRLVKSKSMLTEECHMNSMLESHGISVIDTDLGERIIQLRKEIPSHIVLPAIHLKKEEIGELFHEHFNTEQGASDPTYLAHAARLHLRKNFLEAQAGLTGVNFAIAETGGFVVCTNEGNADMGTSISPLHIACMGIEKIIPRAKDLGVFLRLLARSGTGQPITVYSTHFHGPKPGGELHIVVVDNGRSTLLGREKFRTSLHCIRCAACFNTCPVYRRSGGHSYGSSVAGPIGSIINASRDTKKYYSLPYASSLCGSCTDVCPVKINLHHQLLAWREEIATEGILPLRKRLAMKLAGRVLGSTWLYRMMGKTMRTIVPRLPEKLIYNRLNLWGKQREMPPMPKDSFRTLYKRKRLRKKYGK